MEYKNTQDPAGIVDKLGTWDLIDKDRTRRSNVWSWRITGALCVCLVAVSGALVVQIIKPLPDPLVITSDRITGVPTIVTSMKDQILGEDEVMNDYWMRKFVTHSISYYQEVKFAELDYNMTGMLSSQEVGQGYAKAYLKKREDGYQFEDIVNIKSVVPHKDKLSGSVRYSVTVMSPRTGKVERVTDYIGTVVYEYRNRDKLEPDVRAANPYNFRVTSFRSDVESTGGMR